MCRRVIIWETVEVTELESGKKRNVKGRCVIVCASPERSKEFIASGIQKEDFVICADGGADQLIGSGIVPDLLIGDMDSSLHYKEFENVKMELLPVKKDDSDTMYCVKRALEMGFDNFMLLGATGGRIDHTLANLSVLLYLQSRNAKGVIADEYSQVWLLKSGDNVIRNAKGRMISVIPFACDRACLTYRGMEYQMKQKEVMTEYPYTISNVGIEDEVIVTVHSGRALLVLESNHAVNSTLV